MNNQRIRNSVILCFTLILPCETPAVGYGQDADRIQQTGAGGAVIVHPGSRWIEFRGKAVLLAGDSITQGWMELGENFDQNAYVDAIARRGINLLLLWSYVGIEDQKSDARIGYDAPESWPWCRVSGRFDLTAFNDAYFDRLQSLVKYANSREVVVVITVHDGWTKTHFAGHPFNAVNGGVLTDRVQYVELHDANQEMPARFDQAWGRRQKHQYFLERFCERLMQATADQPNVMYEMFNEGEWYDGGSLRDFQLHFLEFFRKRTERPLVVNDDHAGNRGLREDAVFEVLSLHLPRWDELPAAKLVFDHYAAFSRKKPARPVLFSETVPEYGGEPGKQEGIIRLLWGTTMAGAGVAFQNDTSWGFDSHSALASKSAERDAILDLEGHVARFFNASGLDLAKLKPSGSLSSTGMCLANQGTEYVFYAEENESPFTIDLTRAAGAKFQARWYDPTTGTFRDAEDVAGSARLECHPPIKGQIVLHLRKRAN